MKISKLFHWLYAILMLLPFAFFVPSVLYYAFNDNATMQSVEVPKTETISVDFNQLCSDTEDRQFVYRDLDCVYESNLLSLDGICDGNGFNLNLKTFNITSGHKYYFRCNSTGTAQSGSVWQIYSSGALVIYQINNYIFTSSATGTCGLQYAVYDGAEIHCSFVMNVFDLTQMFGVGNEPTMAQFNEWFPNSYYPYTESELMQITYDTGTTEQLIENTSIINYAWESIWDLPLFSWTKITFVSVPFSYLTGIFGIGASNSLNYVFGYFVTISIVWLVFDLLLYVPMLAHNWIDKARIE